MATLPLLREPPLPRIAGPLRAWLAELAPRADEDRLRALVESLPAPRARLHSVDNMERAEAILLDRFRAAGWEARAEPFAFRDAPGWVEDGSYRDRTLYATLEGRNVLAVREGTRREEAVLVMAHYDTIQHTGAANDNSASVAALLELACVLRDERFERTVVLAATDMEEIGFFGGRALAAHLASWYRIVAAVNFETMAYTCDAPGSQRLPPGLELLFGSQVSRIAERGFRGDFTAVLYNRPGRGLAAAVGAGLAHFAGSHVPLLLRDPGGLALVGPLLRRLVPAVRQFGRSDHLPLWEAGVPTVMVTDTADLRYPHYHLPTDTPERLDYARLASIVRATAAAIGVFAGVAGLSPVPGRRR